MRRPRRTSLLVATVALGVAAGALTLAKRTGSKAEAPRRGRGPSTSGGTAFQPGSSPAGRIQGRVRDGSGPLAGAAVVATSARDPETLSSASCPAAPGSSALDCRCGLAEDLLAWRVADGRGEAALVGKATTGPDGTFELAGLPPGPYALWAEAGQLRAMLDGVEPGQAVELVASPGLELAGSVLDQVQAPLAGAVVTAVHREHSRFFSTRTDAEGRYRLWPLPEGDYEVVAAAPGRIPVAKRSAPGEPLGPLLLGPSRRASGQVTRDGHPVAGALVQTNGSCLLNQTGTDAEGRFVLERLPARATTFVAFSGDTGGVASANLELPDAGHDLVIELRAGGTLAGEVVDEAGGPVSGAAASIEDGSAGLETIAVSGADGRWDVAGLPSGTYFVRLRPPRGFVSPGDQRLKVERHGRTLARYVLLRAETLKGLVRDEAGTPVAGAQVDARRARGWALLPRDWNAEQSVRTFTDGRGRFQVEGLPAGDLTVQVRTRGAPPVEVAASSPGTVVVTMPSGGLEVQVTDERGQAIAGATVTMAHLDASGGVLERDGEMTDAGGRCRFKGLAPGRYRVVAQVAPEGPDDDRRLLVRTVAADATVEALARATVELRLEEGLIISGTAVEEFTGRPLPGVLVLARDRLADPPTPPGDDVIAPAAGGSAVSDLEGRFEVRHLRPGPHELWGTLEGYHMGEGPAGLAAGQSRVVLKLRRQARLTGRVVDERGVPVPSYRVGGEAVAAPDGRFQQAVTWEKPVELRVEAPGFAPLLKTVGPVNADLDLGDLRLTSGRSYPVTVVTARTRAPVAGARLTVGRLDPEHAWNVEDLIAEEQRTDDDGRATLERVPAGDFRLLVVSEGLAPALVTLPAVGTALTVALGEGARVRGTVRNASGAPIRNLPIRADSWARTLSVLSAADGRYEVTGLGAGDYSVGPEAAGGNAGLASRHLTLGPDQLVELDFTESRGATATLSAASCYPLLVRGALPLTAAGVARAWRERLPADTSIGHGQYAFRGLAPGTYTALCEVRAERTTRVSSVTLEVRSEDLAAVVPEPSVEVR